MAGGIKAGVDALITQLAAPPEVAERAALEAAQARAQQRQRSGDRTGFSIAPMIFWGMIILFVLLSACSTLSPPSEPEIRQHVLTWICLSAEGCERTQEVARIDRVNVADFYEFHFTSTQDEAFGEDALTIASDTLGRRCFWLDFLTLFGHELERSKVCFTPGGFELQLSIPNEDPATHSKWLVRGRDLALL